MTLYKMSHPQHQPDNTIPHEVFTLTLQMDFYNADGEIMVKNAEITYHLRQPDENIRKYIDCIEIPNYIQSLVDDYQDQVKEAITDQEGFIEEINF